MAIRSVLKGKLKGTWLYWALKNHKTRRKQQADFIRWNREGQPLPVPHRLKQQALLEYAERYGTRVLFETGTYRGDMVEAMRKHFRKIYSIELSDKLYRDAVDRFQRYKHIQIIHGDSGEKIREFIGDLSEPVLFWLDGHYSEGVTARGAADTPIVHELNTVLGSNSIKHIVIIDDARNFGTDAAYPSLDELRSLVEQLRPDYSVEVAGDSIRLTPAT